MILERLYPGPTETVDGDDRDRLLELYRPPRAEWLRLNLVANLAGNAKGSDGTSETLSNPADRRILGVIRELADVVLIGAQTLRTEAYLQPRRTRLAVVTFSGNLAGHRMPDAEPIVLCPAAAVERARLDLPGAEIIELAPRGNTLPATAVIAALRERGLASIVCEGGPSLAAQLIDAGLADEFCLTTSPRVGGAPFPVTGSGTITERSVSLEQLLRDESSGLYARWGF